MFRFRAVNNGVSQLQASLFWAEHGGTLCESPVNSVSNKKKFRPYFREGFTNRLTHFWDTLYISTYTHFQYRLAAKDLQTFNPLNPELNPICCLLALLGAHHFPHVSRIRVKLLTFRLLMSYIWSTHS